MDDDVQKVYKTIMVQEDRDRDLPIAEKYLSGKRIEWEWIKEQIYTQMYCHTNDNYFYKPMTLYHKDGQSHYDWCQLVLGVQEEIVKFYGQIGSKDTHYSGRREDIRLALPCQRATLLCAGSTNTYIQGHLDHLNHGDP